MANTRNAASLILSVGALTLSIVAFGIAHNQAELQKASARAATGAVLAAQQEKKADATVSSGEVVFVSSLVKATKIEPMEDTLSTVGPLREIEKRARQVEREEKDKDKSNKNGYKQTGERDAYSELYIPSAKIDVTLTNDSFQNDDMVDGAAIYLNSPVLASVKEGSPLISFLHRENSSTMCVSMRLTAKARTARLSVMARTLLYTPIWKTAQPSVLRDSAGIKR